MVLTGMTVVNPEGISSVIEERGCIMHACTHHDAGDPHVSKVADVWVPVCRTCMSIRYRWEKVYLRNDRAYMFCRMVNFAFAREQTGPYLTV